MRGQVPLRAMTEKARPIYMKRNQLNYGMACHPWALPSVSRCRDMNSEGRGGEGGGEGRRGGKDRKAVRWLRRCCLEVQGAGGYSIHACPTLLQRKQEVLQCSQTIERVQAQSGQSSQRLDFP